ncbi:Myricetin O-methyltransferase [Morus notabilis]|uniref:Myricetin O-methyltransferase n=1 Tax=Morus notabilis TaxID=981085 RepID=W9QVA5_9ROSA|nr:trans-resveratrol di-O-methyltransferase [Morus notabilis]EXB54963.1 Myricetin O-methyltransferase [Morus notabilis]
MSSSDELIMSSNELVEAHSLLWHSGLDYMKSMSLKCAIELDIANVIHKHGQPIPFSKLVDSLKIPPSKANFLYRIMRILVHHGFFTAQKVNGGKTQEEEEAYSLTNASRLLLTDEPALIMNMKSLSLFFLLPAVVNSWQSWSTWLKNSDDMTLFETAEGKTWWEYASQEPGLNHLFNDAMANDSKLTAKIILEECKEVLEGLKNLVDVGGGTGTMAKAIVNAFPHIKCTVLDLPHVVANVQETSTDNLNFIGGDMFSEQIPPADAILLKNVLHDWTDEACVTILKRCREAVLSNGNKGKIILIEIVVETQKTTNKETTELQLLNDVFFMGLSAKERTLLEWEKLFSAAGISHYKIIHTFGIRSVIEVYP